MIVLLLSLVGGCWDSAHLRYVAREYLVPEERFVAVAEVESGCNLNPRLRGRGGEIGRLQIKPGTFRAARCLGSVRKYGDNVACGAKILSSYIRAYGETDATVRFNGTGAPALEYLRKVLKKEQG